MSDIERKRREKEVQRLIDARIRESAQRVIDSLDKLDVSALDDPRGWAPPKDSGQLRASWPTPRRCSQCHRTLPEENRSKTCGNLLCAMTQADEETP